MAKRSIEIAISAENRTGAVFEKAKADLRRYADDVNRIQQNMRVAQMAGRDPEEFGAGLGAAQGRLTSARGKAFELQRIAERSAAEREAHVENLRFTKERHDAIRASVGATDQLATNSRTIAEHAGKGAEGFGKMGAAAIKMGAVLAAARIATQAMRIATAALEGDWDAVGEAIKRIPVIGGMAEAGGGLAVAIHRRITGFTPEVRAEIEAANAAGERLQELRAGAERERGRLGMTEEQAFAAKWGEARGPAIEARKKLREGDVEGEALYQATIAEIDKKFGAEDHARMLKRFADKEDAEKAWNAKVDGQQQVIADAREDEADAAWRQEQEAAEAGSEAARLANERDIEKKIEQDKRTEERRKAMALSTADEIARLKVQTTKEGLDRVLALLDLEQQKELLTAEATEAQKAAIREKYGLLQTKARQGERAEATGRAAAGIPAIERGFLTRAPGRQWELEALAAQKTTAKQTEKTVEKLVAIYEAIDRMTGTQRPYPPKVVQF